MRPSATLGALAIMVVSAGCSFPIGNLGNDQFPLPSILATYAHGSATIKLTQGTTTQTIVLPNVGPGSTLNNFTGAGVWWRNEDGWGLLITTYDSSILSGQFLDAHSSASPGPTAAPVAGDLTLQLIAEHDYWTAASTGTSGNRCIIDLDEASVTRVAGSATCRSLRWAYGAAPVQMDLNGTLVDGQDPFNAEITFEATP